MTTPCDYCKYPQATTNDGFICLPNHQHACMPCRAVAYLDAKIHKLREDVIDMENCRQHFKMQLNASHDRITRRMPPEITSTIFQFCLPEDISSADLQYQRSMYVLGAPLILSAVCQRWRNIAHATPRLWSDVPLRVVEKNITLPVLAREWIERSGQLPLSINLYAGRNSKPVQDVIKVLNQFAPRWKILKYAGESAALSHFSSKIYGTLKLYRLSLETWMVNSRRLGKFDLGNLIVQPECLVILRLSHSNGIVIDWSRLKELEVTLNGSLTGQDCLEMFRRAPNLTKCVITRDWYQLWTSGEPILHPNIVDFTLDGNGCVAIFPHLLCPALKTLSVKGFREEIAIEDMFDFFKKSKCSLTTLFIRDLRLRKEDLDLLCRAPAINALHILNIELRPHSGIGRLDSHLFSLLSMVQPERNAAGEVVPVHLTELRSLTILQEDTWDWIDIPSIFNIYFPNVPGASGRHRTKLESLELILDGFGRSFELICRNIHTVARQELWLLKVQGVKFILKVGEDKRELF